MSQERIANLDEIKKFYTDSGCGKAPGRSPGVPVQMPASIIKIAEEMSGKELSLRDAITKIEASVREVLAEKAAYKVYASQPDPSGEGHITLVVTDETRLRGHTYCVINYRSPGQEAKPRRWWQFFL